MKDIRKENDIEWVLDGIDNLKSNVFQILHSTVWSRRQTKALDRIGTDE